MHPGETDWGFQEIEKQDPERASKLANADSSDALIDALDNAFSAALSTKEVQVKFDGIGDDFGAPRVAFQFPVSVELYDWFYNARTGYRAQYWISPDKGRAFNAQLISRFRSTVGRAWPGEYVTGQKELHSGACQRIADDELTVNKSIALMSLDLDLSKIWMCENILAHRDEQIPWIFYYRGPQLSVTKWDVGDKSGLHAWYPEERNAWLEIKGGYVAPDGEVTQPKKSPKCRSLQLHRSGWT